jgi:hypothetical protein
VHANQPRANANGFEPPFGNVPADRLGADSQVIGRFLNGHSRIHLENLTRDEAEARDVIAITSRLAAASQPDFLPKALAFHASALLTLPSSFPGARMSTWGTTRAGQRSIEPQLSI